MRPSGPSAFRLVAEPGRFLISPYGTVLRAREFLEAAEFLRLRKDGYSPVSGFLTCRAVELALKAYLAARGEQWAKITRIGHDLNLLLTEVYARGFDIVVDLQAEDRHLLLSVAAAYQTNEWAYFQVGWVVSGAPGPDPAKLSEVASRLVTAVDPICRAVADGNGEHLPLPGATREATDQRAI